MQHLDLIFGIAATACAATWALRSKLTDIERAISTHVLADEKRFGEHETRIVKLEDRKRGRR